VVACTGNIQHVWQIGEANGRCTIGRKKGYLRSGEVYNVCQAGEHLTKAMRVRGREKGSVEGRRQLKGRMTDDRRRVALTHSFLSCPSSA
jgi:hypothetical protein